MKRDEVIQQVAKAVGNGYSVDLKNPDVVILVEIYRNVLGMSVVDNEYERLKRYNLAEIYEPTAKEVNKGVVEGETAGATIEEAPSMEVEAGPEEPMEIKALSTSGQ